MVGVKGRENEELKEARSGPEDCEAAPKMRSHEVVQTIGMSFFFLGMSFCPIAGRT